MYLVAPPHFPPPKFCFSQTVHFLCVSLVSLFVCLSCCRFCSFLVLSFLKLHQGSRTHAQLPRRPVPPPKPRRSKKGVSRCGPRLSTSLTPPLLSSLRSVCSHDSSCFTLCSRRGDSQPPNSNQTAIHTSRAGLRSYSLLAINDQSFLANRLLLHLITSHPQLNKPSAPSWPSTLDPALPLLARRPARLTLCSAVTLCSLAPLPPRTSCALPPS